MPSSNPIESARKRGRAVGQAWISDCAPTAPVFAQEEAFEAWHQGFSETCPPKYRTRKVKVMSIHKEVDDWLVTASVDTMASLLKAVREAGGSDDAVFDNLDKPFREVLASVFMHNGIRFVYKGP